MLDGERPVRRQLPSLALGDPPRDAGGIAHRHPARRRVGLQSAPFAQRFTNGEAGGYLIAIGKQRRMFNPVRAKYAQALARLAVGDDVPHPARSRHSIRANDATLRLRGSGASIVDADLATILESAPYLIQVR